MAFIGRRIAKPEYTVGAATPRSLRFEASATGLWDTARSPAALPAQRDDAAAPTRGFDVFRLVVALAGLAAFLALPAALVGGVVFLLSR